MGDLIEFYGIECVHCKEIEPLLERLEKELEVKIERYEIWHNQKNLEYFKKIDQGKFGAIPLLYNKKTKKFLFGNITYEKLKKWATEK